MLTPYTGPCTITVANTVIDSKIINCELLIRANNVTIRNSHITGGAIHGLESDGASFRIEDSWIDNGSACQLLGATGGTSRSCARRSPARTGAPTACTCARSSDSWIHGTALDPNSEWHASAVRVEQYATLIHNTLACDYTGPFNNNEIGCSADMTGYADFAPIHNNTIDGNLFMANPIGLGFCAYGGDTSGKPYSDDPANATYIVFTNNVFQQGTNGKCGTLRSGHRLRHERHRQHVVQQPVGRRHHRRPGLTAGDTATPRSGHPRSRWRERG